MFLIMFPWQPDSVFASSVLVAVVMSCRSRNVQTPCFLWTWVNPLNPHHFYKFRKFIKISPVKPSYSGRISSKLMAKHTSFLTKNTAFEHKFHIWYKKMATKVTKYHSRSKKMTLFGQRRGFRRKCGANSVKQSNCPPKYRENVSIYCQTRELRSRAPGSKG
jgi:hypothetical protein